MLVCSRLVFGRYSPRMSAEIWAILSAFLWFSTAQSLQANSRIVVGIETGYGLDDRSSSPGRVKNFLHVVQIGSGVHSTYLRGSRGSFPWGKESGV
jgi:hypothetical protein